VKKGNPYYISATLLTYGIFVSASASRNIVSGNDLYLSGTTASLQNNGTGTILLGGNKL